MTFKRKKEEEKEKWLEKFHQEDIKRTGRDQGGGGGSLWLKFPNGCTLGKCTFILVALMDS